MGGMASEQIGYVRLAKRICDKSTSTKRSCRYAGSKTFREFQDEVSRRCETSEDVGMPA